MIFPAPFRNWLLSMFRITCLSAVLLIPGIQAQEGAHVNKERIMAKSFRRTAATHENALMPKGKPASELTLAAGGLTTYCILIPSSPTTMEEKGAADLAQWLKVMTGADFSVIKEKSGTPYERVLSVGNTVLRTEAGMVSADLRLDGYGIAVKDNNLFITGGIRRGVINGIYALLEEDLGCRWYVPGDAGAVIPFRPTLRFRPVPRVFQPPFELLRNVYYSDAQDVDWRLRNHTFDWSPNPSKWGGYAKWIPNFCHTYNSFLPPAEYFKAHPEYYMQKDDGTRSNMQICPTHPDVGAIVLEKSRGWLRKTPDAVFLDVSPNDGGGACHCPTCKALIAQENTEMAPLLQLVNQVADGIRADHPQVIVTTLAYLNTVVPPKSFGPRPNVVIWLCTDAHAWGFKDLFITETDRSASAMHAWHDRWKAPSIVWDYPSYFNNLPVNFNLPVIASNLRWYAARGAKGILFQTTHNPNYGVDHSYQRSWIFAKLGWDPTLDTQALVRDFNTGFYGAAAPHMQAYEDMLWSAWESWHREKVTDIPWNSAQARKEKRSGQVAVDAAFWTTAETHLTTAESVVAGDELLRRRVRTARLPLMYKKLENGPNGDFAAYNTMINEFEADAKAARLLILEGVTGPPITEDLSRKVYLWRKLATPQPVLLFMELESVWRFAPDSENKGVTERWFDPDYSDLAWASVRPDTGKGWESQGFAGIHLGWYRQKFNITEEMLRRPVLWMLFGAVDGKAEVFINGKLAFKHTDKSTGLPPVTPCDRPFVFDARSFMKAGTNTLAVRVTDTAGMVGILRPVFLIMQHEKPNPQKTLEVIQLIKTKGKIETTTSYGEILFSDNFSGNTVNPPTFAEDNAKWVIDSGAFKADGTAVDGNYQPTAGELNFGTAAGTKIHVDLAGSKKFASLEFNLRHSNGTHANYLFTIRVEDLTVAGSFYDIKMSLNPGYFGTTGFALYANKALTVLGVKGNAIQQGGAIFETLRLEFDPVGGLMLRKNGIEVLNAPNSLKLTKINRISLINESGTVSYFVDNVQMDGNVP